MMDFDELKEDVRNIEYELEYGEEQNVERVAVNVKYLRSVIDFANEAIARQSVKSEDVAEAIKLFESSLKYRKDQEEEIKKQYGGEMPNFLLQVNQKELLAITALQAYQPVAIPKTETTNVTSDGFSYDTKSKQFYCCTCENYFYMPQAPIFCPNCGRRLEK